MAVYLDMNSNLKQRPRLPGSERAPGYGGDRDRSGAAGANLRADAGRHPTTTMHNLKMMKTESGILPFFEELFQ